MKHPIIYTLLGCTIEIAPGGQSAKVARPEIKEGDKVIQSAVSKEFKVVGEKDGTPQVQAQRFVHSLPAILTSVTLEGVSPTIFKAAFPTVPVTEPPQKLTKEAAERIVKAAQDKK